MPESGEDIDTHRRLVRHIEALHLLLDAREAAIAELRAEVPIVGPLRTEPVTGSDEVEALRYENRVLRERLARALAKGENPDTGEPLPRPVASSET